MSSRIPKRERLMNLVSALFAAQEPMPFRDIMGKVIGYDDPGGEEALEKRFDRDKADLRALGIPIGWLPPDEAGGRTRGGYVVDRAQVFQQKVTFNSQEGMLLAIAGRVGAAATGGGALEEALKSALRKLAVDLPGLDPLEAGAEIPVLRSGSGDPRALEHVTVLAHAVTRNRRVRFRYRSLSAPEAVLREVDPYGLGYARGAWYLVAHCHLRNAVRVFKAARIEGRIENCGSEDRPVRFDVPPDFEIERHLERESWDFGDGAPVEVRLAVDPALLTAGLLAEARPAGTHAGRPVVETEVRRPRALIPWVLAHGGQARILDPAWLREEVRDAAGALLAAVREEVPVPVRVPAPTEPLALAEEGLA